VDVAGLASGIVAISAGGGHTCALTHGGSAKCWGFNSNGQLGDGTRGTVRLTPVDVVGLTSGVVAISAGTSHTCALTRGGAAKCWGSNEYGQVGDSTYGTDRLTPVDVAGLASGVVTISAGSRHTCALTQGGAAKCWGNNNTGQLGDGTRGTDRLTPVDVVGLPGGVVAIATGETHTCAVTHGGAAKCWGRNDDGQVGDGTYGTDRLTPIDVLGLPGVVVAISAGGSHTCALPRGGAAKCWGRNEYGQVGDGTYGTNRLMPIDVLGLPGGVVAISAGGSHTCALSSDGAVKCWGNSFSGQLGIEFIRTVVGLDLDGDAAVAEVPTLSSWMLVVTSLLLVGWAYLARRTTLPRFGPRL
jgi:alpha-tubulin suppressor-like RCC1 family protein